MTTPQETTNIAPLYELAGNYAFLADLDTEGDFTEALDQLGADFASKATAIMKIATVLDGQAQNFLAEVERISHKAEAMQNRSKWLKDYLRRCMEAATIDKLEAGTWTLALQNSPPKCEIVEPGLVPEQFRIEVPATWKTDARAIIAAWKDTGEQIPGATVTVGKHLRVR